METLNVNTIDYIITEDSLCISSDTYDFLKSENLVPGTSISLNFLNLILEKEDIYSYVLKIFSKDKKNFVFRCNPNSPLELRSFVSKLKIYEAYEKAIKLNLITFNEKKKERFKILKEMSSLEFYEKCHEKDIYSVDIEDVNYDINVRDFFSLLKMDFLSLALKLEKEIELYGIKKEYFLYALKRYFASNFLETSYIFSSYIHHNYTTIKRDVYADTKAINVFYKKDELLDELEVDSELEEFILNGLDSSFSLLEKAIYIYLKLCKVLTYDAEFFAASQKGKVALNHKNIKHIKEITLENNSVVCYEFCAIFSYLLSKIGITSNIILKDGVYGKKHLNIEFRVGKFIVLADSTNSLFFGDLFGVKLNKPINGLMCFNINYNSQKEFKRALANVYDRIMQEDIENYENFLNGCTLDDLLGNYKILTNNYKEIPFDERVEILFEKVKSIKWLKGMDIYSYIKLLGKNFFSTEELKNNVNFVLVANKNPKDVSKEVMPVGVLCFNPNGFSSKHYENNYYTYSPEDEAKPISYYTLVEMFEKHEYEYIESKDLIEIPGVSVYKEGRGLA